MKDGKKNGKYKTQKKRLAESLQQAHPYHPKQNTKEHFLKYRVSNTVP
jgi:hypothetical protein